MFAHGPYGLLGLLIFIADVYALISIAQSSDSVGKKAIWMVLVFVLPVVGLIIWWLAGPRSRTA